MADSSNVNEADKPVVRFFEITDAHAGQRLDNFLIRLLKGVPKSRVYRIVRKGEVRVNKGRVKVEYRIKEGDIVRVPPIRVSDEKPQRTVSSRMGQSLSDAIVFENDRLLIINKPSGLAVHGGSGVNLGLIEAVRQIRPEARFLELVHRLDRDTSGCVMIAKKRSMLRFLHEQLRSGTIDKRYLALVAGRWPKKHLTVDAPLLRKPLSSGERFVAVDEAGKKSVTKFSIVSQYDQATLIEAKPITGRTHQIRVHALHVGFPLLGDDKYGDKDIFKQFKSTGLNRLFLHAASLTVPMPDDEDDLHVKADLSPELMAVIGQLELDKG